ncbi:maleylpyruvate isomerase family mycothiol-dependent enzyme [Micromonosporaceae bacterium Da 78-11]
MTEQQVRAAVVAERTELAEMLGGLSAAQWDAPTLCAGWRVREVVAHMTMAFRMSTPRFVLEMLKARGDFNRMADVVARRDTAAMTADDLLASLRANVAHPWSPPGGGTTGALSHDVIHGLDISVGLDLDRRPPPERVGLVLGALGARNLEFFGTDLSGVRLEATDLDWSHGAGDPLRGAAQDLLLAICGRRLPAGRLDGTPAARFTS